MRADHSSGRAARGRGACLVAALVPITLLATGTPGAAEQLTAVQPAAQQSGGQFQAASHDGLHPIPLPIPWALNAGSQIVGEYPGDFNRAAVLELGTGAVREIRRPDGQPGVVSAYGINDSGLVIGSYEGPAPQRRENGFLHDLKTGVSRDLNPLPGDNASSPRAINNSGVIVGTSYNYNTSGGISSRAYVLDTRTGTISNLATLTGTDLNLIVHDISDAGWIVGMANGVGFAYNLQSDDFIELPPIAGDASFEPQAINNHGLVVGRTTRFPPGGGSSINRAAAVDIETRQTRLIPGASAESTAFGVNDDGTIVGYNGLRAFAFHPVTGLVDLGVAPDRDSSSATDVNNSGVITLYSIRGTSELSGSVYNFRLFIDIAGSPHADNIERLATLGITGGYPDRTFRPNIPISRAHMAALLKRAYQLPAAPDAPSFPDTVGTTHEAAIRDVAAAGIATGGSDGLFRPNDPVTRGQMAAFIARAEQLPDGGATGFCDTAGHTFEPQIRAVAKAGIAAGGTDGCFHPNDSVTRAQMATFLVRAVD